jgi:uncharacterized SAM-binding protein YcdF (DUF218 family)
MLSQIIHFFGPLGEPLGLLWLLVVGWTIVLIRRRKWREAVFPGALALLIWVTGSTPISARLVATLERSQVREETDEIQTSDAVVMLGGCIRQSKHDFLGVELNDASDRIITAWRLIRQNKGRALVLGGSGRRVEGGDQSDGQLLQDWFAYWGPISVPTYNLGICANTHEEAERVQDLAKHHGWKTIILVTSAYHMDRAEATFRKLGMLVVPVACDFQVIGRYNNPGSLKAFPEIEKIELMGLYLHERIGLLIYRLRGWA